MLRVLELFAGIGGFSVGLEKTGGFEAVGFCEIDLFAKKVLAKNWPGVPIHDDVTTLGPVGPVDLVTAGFPCQDISLAGQGAGLTGPRSGLFWHILRTAGLVGQPRLLLENVAALLGRGLGDVLGALAQVGYDAEWHCIPASAVGAPHRRDRVWIVADAHGQRQLQPEGRIGYFGRRLGDVGPQMADAASERLQRQGASGDAVNQAARGEGQAAKSFNGGFGDFWRVEPDVGRVAHGVPNRAHRLAALGNAVVPQIPEMIGHAILAAEKGR